MGGAVFLEKALEGGHMSRIKSELKIAGMNPVLILTAITAFFTLLAVVGGDLLHLSTIGFEVIFPFFAAIAVGEWGKTRADKNYDAITAQGKSRFSWVFIRFFTIFAAVSLFALISMVIVFLVRKEMPLWEMVVIYFPPAFFLATLAALLNTCFEQEHISALICSTAGLLTLMIRNTLRFPVMACLYLFIRHGGVTDGVWLINKAVLTLLGLLLWSAISLKCRQPCPDVHHPWITSDKEH